MALKPMIWCHPPLIERGEWGGVLCCVSSAVISLSVYVSVCLCCVWAGWAASLNFLERGRCAERHARWMFLAHVGGRVLPVCLSVCVT